MSSYWVKLDRASYVRALALLEGIDRATLNLEPAWREMSTTLRARQILILAQAAKRAQRSKAPSHPRYLQRKASGAQLNGRGDRAMPGAGPLTVTGRARAALTLPQTLEIHPLEMYMGVRVRSSSGKFAGDVAHIVPLHNRFRVSRRPNAKEQNELSHVVLRHIEKAIAANRRG